MKRLVCLSLFAAALIGCGLDQSQIDAIINEILGQSTSGDTNGSTDQGGTSQGGNTATTVRQVFATGPDTSQTGAPVPDAGRVLTVRLISKSRAAASITVRFTINAVEVHLAQINLTPFEIVEAIGPDATVQAEITGAYATGKPLTPVTMALGVDFEEGDVKEYILADPNSTCPNDPNKFEPGICGCGVPDTDSDGDGTPDCNDGCPNDPAKTAPGPCGCGVADTDSDADGTPDCNDGCPTDPKKTAAGGCGCGAAETDADSDGAPDCIDDCPNDPRKTAPGVCGCGILDTDNDGDGTTDCLEPPPPPPPARYTLSVTTRPAGAGSVNVSPESSTYAPNTSVSLTATPTTGYAFDSWEGAATGTASSTTVLMDANKSVTAVFRIAHFGKIIYVDHAAIGANNGSSWTDAFTDLQAALAAASAPAETAPEIWVAAGTYKPTAPGGDRTVSFQLLNGVAIYGGFAATESTLVQRNIKTNVTILSGDLNGDDGSGFANTGENSHHVVTANGTDSTTILDGFTITGGNADAASPPYNAGGGVYNVAASPTLANCVLTLNQAARGGGMFSGSGSAQLTDVVFSENRADNGAGMTNEGASPTLIRCRFSSNAATTVGGGMYNTAGGNPTLDSCEFVSNSAMIDGGGMFDELASPTLTNTVFTSNTAASGGAINSLGDSPALTNCRFAGNTADAGAAIFGVGANATLTGCAFTGNGSDVSYGGAIFVVEGQLTLVGCSFFGNRATQGGGLLASGATLASRNCVFSGNTATTVGGGLFVGGGGAAMVNCTFSANAAGMMGGAVYNEGNLTASITIDNCILWGNAGGDFPEISGTASVRYSCVKAGHAGTGNIASDPLFADAPGPDGLPGTSDDNLRLQAGSPCIDAGDNGPIQATGITTDFDGQPRQVDDLPTPDTGNGTPPIVDMGAYEFQPPPCVAPTLTAIAPNKGSYGSVITGATITGAGFIAGNTIVKLTQPGQPDIVATNVVVTDPATITCDLVISSTAIAGPWDVAVITPCGTGVLVYGFSVESSPPQQHTLSITTSPSGVGYVDCSPPPPLYDHGAPVILTAFGYTDYIFDHWEGDASGTMNPTSIVMDADKSITAVFVMVPPPLDGDGDGVLDLYDLCPNTPPGGLVDTSGCAPPDLNHDSDVDLDDFTIFTDCFNGPNQPAAGSPCDHADFDVDSDVDLDDFALLRTCFNGPNQPPVCLR